MIWFDTSYTILHPTPIVPSFMKYPWNASANAAKVVWFFNSSNASEHDAAKTSVSEPHHSRGTCIIP